MTAAQILNSLLMDIRNRRFAATGKLPSEAQLGTRFSAARMTVRRALDELKRRGLIEKRNGSGSFLTPRAQRQSGVIGLIIPDFGNFSFFALLHREIERCCRRLNYRVEFVTDDSPDTADRVARIRHQVRALAALRAEGVIFRPYVSARNSKANLEIVQILHHAEIPVVLIDSDVMPPPRRSECDLVSIDNIAAGRRIASHLVERGYRRIAFLAPKTALRDNPNWNNRLFGLAGELALLGIDSGVGILNADPSDVQVIRRALRRRNRPDAIVCGNDDNALALLKTAHSLGVSIPQDLAIVGFDNRDAARLVRPALTTVSQPIERIAATAFKMLLARIRYPNNDPREISLPAPLVVRGTT